MPPRSFPLARLLGLGLLFLGLSLGCGGGNPDPNLPPPPPPPAVAPDAGRSSVSADRTAGVLADGSDRVTLTITVRGVDGSPLGGHLVRVEVSGDGNTVTQPVLRTDTQGVTTASVVSTQAGPKQVTATVETEDGAVVISARPTIDFVVAPAVKLVFLASSLSAVAGESVEPMVEVAIQDRNGRTVSGASHEVSLQLAEGPSSTGLEGTLTARAINGVARFSRVVLKQAGAGYVLKATSSGLADGRSPAFEVVPAFPAVLVLEDAPATVVSDSAASVRVTVRDSFGNVATGYRGTVHFSSTEPTAVLPADSTFTEADQGTKSFPFTLRKRFTWEVRVEDTETSTLADSVFVEVEPGPAAQLVLFASEGPYEAGQPVSVDVLLRDAAGNEATGYRGTVRFTSTDPEAVLPADYTFTGSDEGQSSFQAVLKTAASVQQLTVTDISTPALTATLSGEVVPTEPTGLRFAASPANARVRAPLTGVQVEIIDAFGNRARASSPTVTVRLQGGNDDAVLSGTVAVDPVDGLATFANLAVDQEGSGFRLTALAGTFTPVDSATFSVIDDVPPSAVELASTAQTTTSVALAWTSVGDDGSLGAATSYQLRYATHPLSTQAEFEAATLATSGTPQPPGSAEAFTVEGLSPSTAYSFAVGVWDSAGNFSLSNSLQVETVELCAGVVCEAPEPTCAADGVTRVTFSSACVIVDNLPTCQDTEVRTACAGEGGVCFAAACTTASTPAPGELALTEVMHNPSANTTEYLEVHNPTDKLLNLAGLRVEYTVAGTPAGTFTVTRGPGSAVLLPPGGWFVLARDEDFATNGGVPVDYAYGPVMDLGSEGHLALLDGSDTVIEDFAWTSSFPQTPGRSMNLASGVTGTEAHRQPWYWCDSSEDPRMLGGDSGTPGQPNGTCGLAVASAPAFCNIQYPKTFPEPFDEETYPAVIPYGSRKTLYSQFSGPSLTDRNLAGNDDYPHVQVEFGYGAQEEPSHWTWSAARFNPFYGSLSPAFDALRDEIWGWLRILTPGTYSYGFRYRLYDPVARSFSGYTYCDQNGVAADPPAGTYGSVTVSTEPLGPTNHVVISEVATRGNSVGGDFDEFIELYNPTNAPVDLSGWKVQHMPAQGPGYVDLATLPAGSVIPARGFFLLAHGGYSGSVTPELTYETPLAFSGGHLRVGPGTLGSGVVDPATVDKLGWGAAFSPDGDAAPVASVAGSLERKAALLSTAETMQSGADASQGNGLDSEWNADDFVVRAVRDPQNTASPPEAP